MTTDDRIIRTIRDLPAHLQAAVKAIQPAEDPTWFSAEQCQSDEDRFRARHSENVKRRLDEWVHDNVDSWAMCGVPASVRADIEAHAEAEIQREWASHLRQIRERTGAD